MKCTICEKPIILEPSASERAKKFGGKLLIILKPLQNIVNVRLKKETKTLLI